MEVLLDEVRQLKDDYCYPDLGRAFQHWSAVNVLGLVDEDVATEMQGSQAQDAGIDYMHVDDDTSTVNILQTKFSDKFNTNISNEDLSSFFSTPDRLSNGYQGSNAFRERRAQYADAMSRGFKTNLIFIATGDLTDTNKDEIQLRKSKLSTKMKFDCLENKDLPALIGNPPSRSCKMGVVEDEIFVGKSLDMGTKKAVATIRCSELARIYNEIGSTTLFSANPRKYLGSNPTSRSIKETLESSPERLWHYNNGVSAVCKSFEYDERDRTLKIENFKIVNGCQTVTTIAKQKLMSEHATVLLRLSEVLDEGFLLAISTNTNHQQRVKAADLYSDRKELKILAQKFKEYPGFFWERKRGDFRELDYKTRSGYTKEKRKKLYVIDNDTAARLKLAFGLGLPHLSITLAQTKIFSDDEIGDSELRPFDDIYGNSEPSDFILPNIFLHLIKDLDVGHHQDSERLVKIALGRYYVIAMIGEILRRMQDEKRSRLETQIIKAATDYDEAAMAELSCNIQSLVKWMADVLPKIIDQDKQASLHEYAPTGLRDKLKDKNVLANLRRERQSLLSLYGEEIDPFEKKLSQTFAA